MLGPLSCSFQLSDRGGEVYSPSLAFRLIILTLFGDYSEAEVMVCRPEPQETSGASPSPPVLLLLTQKDAPGVSEEDGRQDVWTDCPAGVPPSAGLTAAPPAEPEEQEQPRLDGEAVRPAGP